MSVENTAQNIEDINLGSTVLSNGKTVDEVLAIVDLVGEEIIDREELRKLLLSGKPITIYDGFEPSGRMHIAQGLMKAVNIKRLIDNIPNVTFIIWIADWFAMLNKKFGSDLEKINNCGKYFIECWKAAGVDMSKVQIRSAFTEITKEHERYFRLSADVAERNSLARMVRCSQIMGRSDGDALSASQILYPTMQCTDIFYLGADICQLGLDQRKVNILAREYVDQVRKDKTWLSKGLLPEYPKKPIIVSHHMILGLLEGQVKASKSHPSSAVYMEDDWETVDRKIMGAYCPEDIDKNPVADILFYIVLPTLVNMKIGAKEYNSRAAVTADWNAKKISAEELKRAVADGLNEVMTPVRKHFEESKEAQHLFELVQSYAITR